VTDSVIQGFLKAARLGDLVAGVGKTYGRGGFPAPLRSSALARPPVAGVARGGFPNPLATSMRRPPPGPKAGFEGINRMARTVTSV